MRTLTDDQVARVRALEQDGRLTPDAVLIDATDEDSPLHTLFPWDDKIAADRHRLDIARSIIREVHYTYTINRVTVKAVRYVRDPSIGKDRGYVTTEAASNDPDTIRQVMAAELARIIGMIERTERLAVALGEPDALALVAQQMRALRGRYESPLTFAADSVAESDAQVAA